MSANTKKKAAAGKRGLGRRTSSSSSTGSASGRSAPKTADLRNYFTKATDTPTNKVARKVGRPLFTPTPGSAPPKPATLRRQTSASCLGSSSSAALTAAAPPVPPALGPPSMASESSPQQTPRTQQKATVLNRAPPAAALMVPAAAPAAWLDLAAPRAQVQLKGSAPYDTGGAMAWQSTQLALPTAPSPTTGRFSTIVGRNPKVCDCVIDSDQESDFKGMSRSHASLTPTADGKQWCITAVGSGAVLVNGIKIARAVLAHGDAISFPAGAALASVKVGDAYAHRPESDTNIRLYFRLTDQPLPTMTIVAAQLLYGAQVLLADKDGGIEGWAAIEQEGTRDVRVKWPTGFPSSTYSVKELLQRVLEHIPPCAEVTNALDEAKLLPPKRTRAPSSSSSSSSLAPSTSVRATVTATATSKPKKRPQTPGDLPAGVSGVAGKRPRVSSSASDSASVASASKTAKARGKAADKPAPSASTAPTAAVASVSPAAPSLRAPSTPVSTDNVPAALRRLMDFNGRGSHETSSVTSRRAPQLRPPSGVPGSPASASPSRRSNRDRTGELREKARIDALLSTPDKRNKSGETALHQEVIKNNIGLVKTLIGKGASVDVVCLAGWSPLHEACNHGFAEMVKLLIKHGADVNAAANADAETPLHDAVLNGHLDCAKLLLQAKADVNAPTNGGDVALDYADDKAMIKYLKSKGAKNTSSPKPEPEADEPPARKRSADGKAKAAVASSAAATKKDAAASAAVKGKSKAKASAQFPSPKKSQSDDDAYYPECIIASRLLGGDLQFDIKWYDYPRSEATWEAAANVLDGQWRHLQCGKCKKMRVIIENGARAPTKKVQASGFRCSKVKRHCYEPCDEGREAVTKPANVELDSAQATLWSSLNGTRMEYWDFTDGAVLDDVDPRNDFEHNAWDMDDWQTTGEDFFAGSEAPTMSKPLDDRMGINLTLMRSHVSTMAKPHAKHQLWLASLLAGQMKREGGVLQKKYAARSRAWGRVLSDMLADAAFEANGKPSGVPIEGATIARAEEAWQAFHLVVALAYIPVDPADTGSAKANQVGTARAILADMVLRGSSVAALMRANSSGLRDSITILVSAVMPSSSKYRDGLLDKVAQPLLSEIFTAVPEERAKFMEELCGNYHQMDIVNKRRFLLSIPAPAQSAGSYKETFLLKLLGRYFTTVKLAKTPAGEQVDRTWQALASVLQCEPAAFAAHDVDQHSELLELMSQLLAMLCTDSKLADAQQNRSPTIVPSSWLHRFSGTFDRFAKDPTYPGLQFRVRLFIARCDELE